MSGGRPSGGTRSSAAPRPSGGGSRGAVGGALAGAPGPKLESLSWRDNALDLNLNAPNTDAIARFAQGINERGLAADVTSTTNGDKGLQARVRIAAGGAQ